MDDHQAAELQQFCETARPTIDARRGTVPIPDPVVGETLRAIAARIAAAGYDQQVADNTVTRWYITRSPILDCLAIEVDPPYPTERSRPGTMR